MILLGLVLIIIGAALLYFVAEPIIRFIGAALAIVGLVLIIWAVVPADDNLDNDHGSHGPKVVRSSWGKPA